MKTQTTLQQKNSSLIHLERSEHFFITIFTKRTLSLITFMMLFVIVSNPISAQTKTNKSNATSQEIVVKGSVSDEFGPLPQVNITLEGTDIGTSTDKKGAFTFPKSLKLGDVIVFSHLAYETVKIKVNENSSFIKLVLTPDVIEVVGDLNLQKPYKSKRSN